VIQRDNLLAHAATLGEQAMSRLRNESRLKGKVTDVRGRGVMIGVELAAPPEKFVERGLERGLVLNLTAKQVIRLAPAINIRKDVWDAAIDGVIDLIASL
jgi:acetylornithine aminotransferase